ncbi:MAG TPA: glycosyltransferase family 4 protein, partial [Burkholderiales bacterium]|nr:glycosyltransferase family 4 protein [Burkholderiales bacterium]
MIAARPAPAGPPRVTLVTHYFPRHRGGVESVAWEIASRLARSESADITWHASATDEAPSAEPHLRYVPAPAWNVAERRLGLPFPVWSPAALVKLTRAVRACDVVHLHDFLYLPNLVAWAAARLCGRPVIITQHVGPIRYRNPLLRFMVAVANRALGKLVLGSAAQAFFVSHSVLEYFRGFVRFRNPPQPLPNGVDAKLFAFADEHHRRALRAGLGVSGDTPLLLFGGRFVEKKGLPMLRAIAERLPGARWVFVGWGPQDPELWRLPQVSVQGNLARDELVPLYQAADLLVLPSFGEGFPLVVQEAMACGTPALVSDETAGGCPELADILAHEPLAGADAIARWTTRIEALLASRDELAS